MMREISEKDWKLFREKLTTWQDTYIDKLNQEYIEILRKLKELFRFFMLQWRRTGRFPLIYETFLKKGA